MEERQEGPETFLRSGLAEAGNVAPAWNKGAGRFDLC